MSAWSPEAISMENSKLFELMSEHHVSIDFKHLKPFATILSHTIVRNNFKLKTTLISIRKSSDTTSLTMLFRSVVESYMIKDKSRWLCQCSLFTKPILPSNQLLKRDKSPKPHDLLSRKIDRINVKIIHWIESTKLVIITLCFGLKLIHYVGFLVNINSENYLIKIIFAAFLNRTMNSDRGWLEFRGS